MPLDILASLLFDGPDSVPGYYTVKKYLPYAIALAASKYYFVGASNTWERDMHGRVFLVTGGTSGMGAAIVRDLAEKGAQIILLVRTEDSWTVDYIEDLRDATNNPLIYAEQCDLADLHSVRKFATKWLDNSPPRRLDGVICCASEALPPRAKRARTANGVDRQIGVNYLGHFHLLTLLSPSLRVQPADRDVRVVIANCSSHTLGEVDPSDLLWESRPYPRNSPWKVHGTSKMLLGLFAKEYQRQMDRYERPDKAPVNVSVTLVNPGIMRTASTRRFLSMGSVVGLLIYMIMWPLWWLVLKSPTQGTESLLFALCAPMLRKMDGGQFVQECKIVTAKGRSEYGNVPLQEQVFAVTEKEIERLEKKAAVERNKNMSKEEREERRREREEKKAILERKPRNVEELDKKLERLRNTIEKS